MGLATYVQVGDMVDYTPGSAVSEGDVVVQNTLVGVATRDIAASALGALAVSGVFDFPKSDASSSAIEAGKKVYWDSTNEVATETSSGNTYLGKTTAAADDDDTTVRVRLEQ